MSRAVALAAALVLFSALPAQAGEPFLRLDDVLNALAPAPQQAPQPREQAPQQPTPPREQAPAPHQANGPIHMDEVLAREHQRFTQFATEQVQRMNATMLGGKNSMQVNKDGRGRHRASYKHIDLDTLVCQVRRSENNPNYFVGVLLYKEHVMESVAGSAEACRRGPFESVRENPSRIIYSSKHGGGWQ